MSSPKPPTPSPESNTKDIECDTSTSTSSISTPSTTTAPSDQGSGSRELTPSSSASVNYNYMKSLQFSKPTSDSDESTDGFPKYGHKRSDTLPNSYFSTLPSLGWQNPEMQLESYSSEEDNKEKVFSKGKSLLKKNNSKSSKRKSNENRLKDSVLSSYADICYKCKLCKSAPCYMVSVESFIFHMKNQHPEEYKEMLKPVTNGKCHQDNKPFEGSSSDDGSCVNSNRITSEHLLRYSKLWQNSPKSSATDPKHLEDNSSKASSSSSNSKQSTPIKVSSPVQKVTEQFLKSSDNLALPGSLSSSSAVGMDTAKSSSLSPNAQSRSPLPQMPTKTEQGAWKSDLPPSFTPEFGRYTKLVREGGNIVYFCQVCNWKCQVKAAFGVHCNGQSHHNKARLADQNNFDKCKQKSEPNNVKAAIRKAIDYRDSLNKQATNNNTNSVKLPIINVPKLPNFNKVVQNNSDPSKPFSKFEYKKLANEQERGESRNKRKKPFPTRRTSTEGEGWADSESDDDMDTKKHKPDNVVDPTKNSRHPNKVINPFLSNYPTMIPMDDYFSRYSSQKTLNIRNASLFDNEDNKHKADSDDTSFNLPMFPTVSSGFIPESRDDNLDIQYRCTFCNVYCAGLSDYKDHFRSEHDIDSPDLTMADGKGGQNNEWWKMMKIKETLSDLLINCPKGNVSRDLLLHKVSLTLNMPEVLRWGPSCNKAVREEFPNSMAQRKGKFKKTYFFGVSFIDQVIENDDVSDGEMNYQPLRDMSNDLERILEHLPTLIKWTGNQITGISRDDVLELLAKKIDEREVTHWGVQCNRAIRMLYPDVQMKRKGKYKTVFYGVDFVNPSDKQTTISKLDGDKDDYLPVSFGEDDIKQSPYSISNPLLGYNPMAAQHNELAMQYQSQLFNMWRFMSPYHPYPLQPTVGMVGNMGGNSFTKRPNSVCSSNSLNREIESPIRGCSESPVLSVGSKSDFDQFLMTTSKASPCLEDSGQQATNCSVEERKDRELDIISASPVSVVTS